MLGYGKRGRVKTFPFRFLVVYFSRKRLRQNIKCRHHEQVKNEDKNVHLSPCFEERRLLIFYFWIVHFF